MHDKPKKIYGSRHDTGQTRLLSGELVHKDDPRLKACGALDELQSHLGMARSYLKRETIGSLLYAVQEDVMVASSQLALSSTKKSRLKRHIGEDDVRRLEKWIDDLTDSFGLPGRFVVAGESTDSAALHVARAVCRRCERIIITTNRQTGGYEHLMAYFNRLSDLLFVAAWSREVMAELENLARLAITGETDEGSAQ